MSLKEAGRKRWKIRICSRQCADKKFAMTFVEINLQTLNFMWFYMS